MNTFRAAPVLKIDSGTLEALKWFAVLSMTIDHVNHYLLDAQVPFMFNVGRLAMPIFGFVLGYSLGHPQALSSGIYKRVSLRLLLWGSLACIPFEAMSQNPLPFWPLNIMIALLLVTLMAWLLDRGGSFRVILAIQLFTFGGLFVEFFWPGLVTCLCVWGYRRQPSWILIFVWVAALACFVVFNGNSWALAAIAILVGAPFVRVSVPRLKHIFYVYYPLHLSVIWVLSRTLFR